MRAGGSVLSNELWNAGFTVNRNDPIRVGDNARDFGEPAGSVAAGSTIETISTALDAMGFNNTVNWTDGAHTPGYDGTHHLGQVTVLNNESAQPTRREIIFQNSAGTSQLFGVGVGVDVTLANNGAVNTVANWQARDNVTMSISRVGVDSAGNQIALTAISRTFWEGDSGAYNATNIAPGLGFSEIFFKDAVDNAAELQAGDSWTIYTQAATAANHDQLDFTIYDQFTGNTSINSGGTLGGMQFNNGVLDGSNRILPQMIRTNPPGPANFAVVYHDVEFGTNITTTASALRYNERYASPATYNYYAHTAPLTESSYFFGNGQSLVVNVPAATVWRQEDDNCSLLFTVNADGTLKVDGKGYSRNGTVNDFSVASMAVPGGGPVTVGCIQFDNLSINPGLAAGDKFVLNVVARAGGPGSGYMHAPGPGTFNSDAELSITGNPWSVSGSTMEYRFDENAEDGKTFDTLGWFVHPTDGADNAIGVWTGQIQVATSAWRLCRR